MLASMLVNRTQRTVPRPMMFTLSKDELLTSRAVKSIGLGSEIGRLNPNSMAYIRARGVFREFAVALRVASNTEAAASA